MSVAKKAKPACPAKKAKPAKAAKAAKAVGNAVKGAAGAAVCMALALAAGCAMTFNSTPIMSESAGETVVAYARTVKTGFGNKEATTLGNYTLSADGGLSISNLSNQNDASLALLKAIELGASLGGAYLGRGAVGVAAGAVDVAPGGSGADASVPSVAPGGRRPAINTVLDDRIAEAKASGKTLVVVAGHPLCGYCTRLEAALDASGISARPDIVLVRELNPWEANAAALWTGGGNAPIVRVTRWDTSGGLVCDRKLNRPGTVGEIEAAISACALAVK